MNDLSHLKQKDTVRVFDNQDHGDDKIDGHKGTVSSVGRKYLVITYRRGVRPERDIRVQISDGRSPDLHRQYTVLPEMEAAQQAAREHDRLMLLRAGLAFTSSGFEELMDDELLHQLAELVEPYVLTTVAERTRRMS
jgi:hypothetical protein